MLKTELKKCSGCAACFSVCPVSAILMKEDIEGFKYPIVDMERCISCGLCNESCPAQTLEPKGFTSPKCFSATTVDDETRANSSSGGVFSSLAEYILKLGGFVSGVYMDENQDVRHILISEKKDLWKLRGSKYVQSDLGDIYKQVKEKLDNDKLVFFVGTPCQVAGLNSFLNKTYENLLTADLICHGVPSLKIFRAYLQDNFAGQKIESISFRAKPNGWKNFEISVNTDKKTFSEHFWPNLFMKGFLSDLYCRPSCSTCDFASVPRHSDLTLGDFWGVEKFDKKLDDDKGLSIILINSNKGKKYFAMIENQLSRVKEVPLKMVKKKNRTLSNPWPANPRRFEFFRLMSDPDFKFNNAINHIFDNKSAVGIMNLFWTVNYGAVLTAYALFKLVENQGLSTKLIQFREYPYYKKWEGSPFERFANKHLQLTNLITHISDLDNLNDEFSTFIVGSDQVWRNSYTGRYGGTYFFDFVKKQKKMISFAASFGISEYDGDDSAKKMAKQLLKRFHFISVREKDAVDICKNEFDIDAQWILDPVFLLGKNSWASLADESTKDCSKPYVAYNILDKNKSIMDTIIQSTNLPLVDIIDETQNEVVDWLKYIRDCDFFITDSFHGVCFALIFQKQFICLANKQRGLSRFESLLSFCRLEDRIVFELTKENILQNMSNVIDYVSITDKFCEVEKSSNKFLIDALSSGLPVVEETYEEMMAASLSRKVKRIEYKMRYPVIVRKYLVYSFLSKITFGKLRENYKEKVYVLRAQKNIVKNWLKRNIT